MFKGDGRVYKTYFLAEKDSKSLLYPAKRNATLAVSFFQRKRQEGT